MGAPTDTEWTDDEIEQIKRLWADGLSAREIGAIVKRTRNGVISKVRRLDLARRAPERVKKYTTPVFRAARKPTKPESYNPVLPASPDTRTRFARFMGDPPPGRSALDKKRATGGTSARARTVFHTIHRDLYETAENHVAVVAAQESFRADPMQGGGPKGIVE